jgi:hypothetical protein
LPSHLISQLFISEGQGLVVERLSFCIDDDLQDQLELGSIRFIAEQLDLIGYEVLNGNVELKIIYFEIGQIMDTMHQWIVENSDDSHRYSIKSTFPYLTKMYKKYHRQLKSVPCKKFVTFD